MSVLSDTDGMHEKGYTATRTQTWLHERTNEHDQRTSLLYYQACSFAFHLLDRYHWDFAFGCRRLLSKEM